MASSRSRITREKATGIVRKITNEAYTIWSMIRSCDVDLAHDEPFQLKRILAIKTVSIISRWNVIHKHLGDVEALRT
jgi:hypothetical protein